MCKIIKIQAREVIDSRGWPTIEVETYLENGISSKAIVPSGASTGINEALELRDNDINRYLGKGVLTAINNVNNIISKKIVGLNVLEQSNIDNIMIDLDGTPNKSNLGSNSILGVSLSIAKVGAKFLNLPLYSYISKINNSKYCLPIPMMNVINGGCHADNNLDIQEFMIYPIGADNFSHCIRMCSEVFHNLGNILKINNKNILIGDEGGYAPNLNSNEEAIILICEAIEKSNYILGKDIFIAIDCAASEFYNNKNKLYYLNSENKKYSFYEFTEYLNLLIDKYPIISIEDALSEKDWDGFIYLTSVLGDKVQIVGDDLFVTNTTLLNKGIKYNIANSILIKPNQIGTLTETLNCINLAKNNNYSVIISHRSGETEDTTISDLAVGTNSSQIKCGSISRSERTCKYNRLIRIEEYLNKNIFKGISQFKFLNNNKFIKQLI